MAGIPALNLGGMWMGFDGGMGMSGVIGILMASGWVILDVVDLMVLWGLGMSGVVGD